jgi:predicted patatin/cPLA2 family phospholipase
MLKLMHHWYWGRAKIGDYKVISSWITGEKKYGYQEFDVFMLAKGGEILGDNANHTLKFLPKGRYTDEETGKPVYQNCPISNAESMQWFRASASMPLVSRVVEVGGYRLLDGGVSDSIPLRWFESIGYERNLVILTQPEDYEKKPSKILPVLRRALRRFPRTVEALANRHQNYNEATAYVKKRENEGAALVIRPAEKLPIGHVEHDAQKMRAVYELGRTAGQQRLADMKNFLKENRGGCDR